MRFLLVVLCVVAAVAGQCIPRDEYRVRTTEGVVRGCQKRSRKGRAIATFLGIRYAQPPTGDLRFAPPQPAESWPGVMDVCEDAPMCIQKNYLLPTPTTSGSEDCLFLNVFTNKLPGQNENLKNGKPVLVYIHGGGWFAGSGASYFNGPEYFMDEEVVLVTLNYRLGVFGFLSTNDDSAVGNWGLRDQILALKWVQRNIERFGGNPNSVTIFGQSAGAASVHYLVLSPITKGLFHRAISQSGSALNLWGTPKDSLAIAKLQGKFVNCSWATNAELVECLRQTNATALVESGDKFKFWDVDPLTIFIPSIEKKTEKNPEPFIEEHPRKLVQKGKFHRIPYVMGVMQNEGIIRAAPISSIPKLRDDLNAHWNELGPKLFAISESVPENKVQELWKEVTEFYMQNKGKIDATDSDNIQNFVDMYSDRSFVYGMYQTALAHAKYVPVYFYKIDYSGQYSYSTIFKGKGGPINHVFNISHCDDLIYLFNAPLLFPPSQGTDADFSQLLVSMWASFAKESVPFGKFWSPLTTEKPKEHFRHLSIDGPVLHENGNRTINLAMKLHFFTERMKFWSEKDVTENT